MSFSEPEIDSIYRPGFSDALTFSGFAAMFGALIAALYPIGLLIWTAGPAAILAIVPVLLLSIFVASLTALPFGLAIAWPMFRLVGFTQWHAMAVGIAVGAIIAFSLAGVSDFRSPRTFWGGSILFVPIGMVSGWLSHRITFGSVRERTMLGWED